MGVPRSGTTGGVCFIVLPRGSPGQVQRQDEVIRTKPTSTRLLIDGLALRVLQTMP